ncbi:integrase core domain-containing protein [Haliea sp. E1-2-M8]|uniref:integrase core domain-containing protein n=1 Tax=Haliea sp. E1-2-M8 TaxID=3064706 RepID=UPI002724A928|nr:integrase core domain-containing protein [Haliea sp. E1-2-M8]MDO8863776.1 integrase core domain-containing protein [Haliea sp. E1-2-M8]
MMQDIFSRKIVGWEVHSEKLAEHASTLISKACMAEGIRLGQLALHADNGSPLKGATMLATLQRLGIVPSFSRPSVSDDNPYSESLFRTLKYTPAYPHKPFESIVAAHAWVYELATWYNNEHRHSAIKYVTPAQRHAGLDTELLQQRQAVYEAAKVAHLQRWSGPTRNWERTDDVWLNQKELCAERPSLVKAA